MASKPSKGYAVGYGRPPVHSRFKPGQSGNSKGRAKGEKNLGTVLAKALNERVAVTENGKRRSISKLEAAIKQLVNKAASGDGKAISLLLNVVRISGEKAGASETSSALSSDADQQVMQQLQERLQRCARTRALGSSLTADNRTRGRKTCRKLALRNACLQTQSWRASTCGSGIGRRSRED